MMFFIHEFTWTVNHTVIVTQEGIFLKLPIIFKFIFYKQFNIIKTFANFFYIKIIYFVNNYYYIIKYCIHFFY